MSSILPDPSALLLDRIKASMVGLKMPRAILSATVTRSLCKSMGCSKTGMGNFIYIDLP